MSKINNLKNLLSEPGTDFYENLMSSEVTVFEKLDGLNFGFTVFPDTELRFFKKNPNMPLGVVDRTLTSVYEPAVFYIDTLSEDVRDALPEAHSFGFVYFPNTSPNSIAYDNIPPNNLVLSYVEDITGVKITNPQTLNFYADILGVGRPPIHFKGKLSIEQKDKIQQLVHSTKEDDRTNLIGSILKVLVPGIKKTYLNDDIDKTIEGVIFKFDTGEETNFAKLTDETFEEIFGRRKIDTVAKDNYYLVLSDVLDFLMDFNIEKIGLRKRNFEDRYIELICNVFNAFIETKGLSYINMDYDLPDYIKNGAGINLDNISNSVTRDLINKYTSYSDLFGIILSSFRKKRKRTNVIFTDLINKHFNDIVKRISNKCSIGDSLNESFITFDEFRKVYIQGLDSKEVLGLDIDVYNQEHAQNIIGYMEPEFDVSNFMKTMFIDVAESAFKVSTKPPVNLMIDSFTPMLDDQLLRCREMYETTMIPFILVVIRSENPWFTIETQNKIMKIISDEACIASYMVVDKPVLSDIFSVIKEEYSVSRIIAPSSYKSLMEIQVRTNSINNNVLGFRNPMDPIDYYTKDQSIIHRIESYIQNNDYNSFKKHVPDVYAQIFPEIRSNADNIVDDESEVV